MIDIDDISLSYKIGDHTIPALSSVSLHIERGEYAAILGPNGSGKSTLLKAICGLVRPDSGRIYLLDKDVRPGNFGNDYFGKVGVVFQEPEGQFLMRDVRTEIISVLENLGLSTQTQKTRFESLVERFDLAGMLDQKPENLSGGQMQIVNLACAMAGEPQVLLLDEPTTFLDSYYKSILLNYLSALHKAGMTILHITQFPDEAMQAERICILDGGKLVDDCGSARFFEDEGLIEKHKLISPLKMRFRKVFGFDWNDGEAARSFCQKLGATANIIEEKRGSGKPSLTIKELRFHYGEDAFGISIDGLDLAQGRVTGLVGATGSGKSTLALLLAGLLSPDSGVIEFEGRPLGDFSIKELRSKVGITWQLPDLAMIGPTVKDDIEFSAEHLGIVNLDIKAILRRAGLEGFENRIVDTLSGGEKRKLSLAGILAANPDYLILDEPTAFLDPVSQKELIKIIRGLSREGRGILIAGHDLHFISELADKIIGIKDGKIICDLAAPDFFSDPQSLKALDLPVDPMVAFRHMLAQAGHQPPFGSLEPERIREWLENPV